MIKLTRARLHRPALSIAAVAELISLEVRTDGATDPESTVYNSESEI